MKNSIDTQTKGTVIVLLDIIKNKIEIPEVPGDLGERLRKGKVIVQVRLDLKGVMRRNMIVTIFIRKKDLSKSTLMK